MKVLFVCTGNTCRSPMAEGILRSVGEKNRINIEVKSAGISVYDGGKASKNSIEAMRKIDIDISGHESRQLHGAMVEEADLILTMTRNHRDFIVSNFPSSKGKVYTLLEYAYKVDRDVADPYGGSLPLYEHTRDEIYQAIVKMRIDN